jgi:hypothetical protein
MLCASIALTGEADVRSPQAEPAIPVSESKNRMNIC